MRRAAAAKVNNDYYHEQGDNWWNPDQALNVLQAVVNPGRVGYFTRVIRDELKLPTTQMKALEVGCGGGVLTEEIARMGFRTTGIDQADAAIEAARAHSRKSGLDINFVCGRGERLPFEDASFDVVFCCDVLEHVNDIDKVISEISRVLKPGGHVFYDTLNRTFASKVVAINVYQEWSMFSFLPKGVHVWELFIRPEELAAQLAGHQIENLDVTGLAPKTNVITLLYYLYRRAKGKIGFRELYGKMTLKESKDTSILYVGHGRKRA